MKRLTILDGNGRRMSPRFIATAAVALGLATVLTNAPLARATNGEIIPSFGYSKAVDGDVEDGKGNVGLAVRGDLGGHLFQAEIGSSYRSESRFDGDLKLRIIPVTASILISPVRTIHADVGAGWYFTKFDYDDALLLEDETKQEFGVHLGGGLQVPIASRAAVDLTGRYVMLQDQESKLVPEKFNPDFWNMSLGLAFKF